MTDKVITSKILHDELNEERKKDGLVELPAVNSRNGGNTYARKDSSFKNVADFFRQLINRDKENK